MAGSLMMCDDWGRLCHGYAFFNQFGFKKPRRIPWPCRVMACSISMPWRVWTPLSSTVPHSTCQSVRLFQCSCQVGDGWCSSSKNIEKNNVKTRTKECLAWMLEHCKAKLILPRSGEINNLQTFTAKFCFQEDHPLFFLFILFHRQDLKHFKR